MPSIVVQSPVGSNQQKVRSSWKKYDPAEKNLLENEEQYLALYNGEAR